MKVITGNRWDIATIRCNGADNFNSSFHSWLFFCFPFSFSSVLTRSLFARNLFLYNLKVRSVLFMCQRYLVQLFHTISCEMNTGIIW